MHDHSGRWWGAGLAVAALGGYALLTRHRPWLDLGDLDLGALTAQDLRIVPPRPAGEPRPEPPAYIALSLDELVRLDGRRVLYTLER